MVSEAISVFLDGDIDTGKSLLRDYLNATNSMPGPVFEPLAALTSHVQQTCSQIFQHPSSWTESIRS